MTQVAELHQEWRRTSSLMRDARTPWEQVRGLSGHATSLGLRLLEAPAAGLNDLAIKVQWLAEQELDHEAMKEGLRRVLRDIQILQRQ